MKHWIKFNSKEKLTFKKIDQLRCVLKHYGLNSKKFNILITKYQYEGLLGPDIVKLQITPKISIDVEGMRLKTEISKDGYIGEFVGFDFFVIGDDKSLTEIPIEFDEYFKKHFWELIA